MADPIICYSDLRQFYFTTANQTLRTSKNYPHWLFCFFFWSVVNLAWTFARRAAVLLVNSWPIDLFFEFGHILSALKPLYFIFHLGCQRNSLSVIKLNPYGD